MTFGGGGGLAVAVGELNYKHIAEQLHCNEQTLIAQYYSYQLHATYPYVVAVLYLNGTDSAASSRGADAAHPESSRGDVFPFHPLFPPPPHVLSLFIFPKHKEEKTNASRIVVIFSTGVNNKVSFPRFPSDAREQFVILLEVECPAYAGVRLQWELDEVSASNSALNGLPHSC